MTRNVLVIGLGLIGGSVALALQKAPHTKVFGYDAHEQTRELACTLNVVNEVVEDPAQFAEQADVIIFGTPVNITLDLMEQLKNWNLKRNVIITDTGSTKARIMEKALELRELGITFIGGHPMAGSHKSGITAAKPYLLENAYYMLTPTEGEEIEKIAALDDLLKFTLGKMVVVDAKAHDHMTAVVSHFPHIVAASLVHQLNFEKKAFPMTSSLAAGGFRDITRIASSNPTLWRDITLQNQKELVGQLDIWLDEMGRIRQLLEQGDAEEIERYFADARDVRDKLPVANGALYMPYDLYVDIPDYPGVISEVTGYLANENISIINIRIVETRVDVFGILVISFQTNEDRERAAKCIIQKANYDTHIS
ncbi:prephenate dehydrogenase [Solibacillus sp. R5-41]|uniref:prephenate dehydrogenase n=1 Tax=Solibacillus sp. R5-41 TaxID=2048654 RepID=UPI000C12724C|nr:prephenate dehydrogenase [Solibacillus sp. R5-41]ATP39628.1 prephenate dehydrogenase [Solibacillus sp. R5-41]